MCLVSHLGLHTLEHISYSHQATQCGFTTWVNSSFSFKLNAILKFALVQLRNSTAERQSCIVFVLHFVRVSFSPENVI